MFSTTAGKSNIVGSVIVCSGGNEIKHCTSVILQLFWSDGWPDKTWWGMLFLEMIHAMVRDIARIVFLQQHMLIKCLFFLYYNHLALITDLNLWINDTMSFLNHMHYWYPSYHFYVFAVLLLPVSWATVSYNPHFFFSFIHCIFSHWQQGIFDPIGKHLPSEAKLCLSVMIHPASIKLHLKTQTNSHNTHIYPSWVTLIFFFFLHWATIILVFSCRSASLVTFNVVENL